MEDRAILFAEENPDGLEAVRRALAKSLLAAGYVKEPVDLMEFVVSVQQPSPYWLVMSKAASSRGRF